MIMEADVQVSQQDRMINIRKYVGDKQHPRIVLAEHMSLTIY